MGKRQHNFSGKEVELLVSEVEKREKILFGKLAPGLSSAVKDAGWGEVAAKVSAVGGVKRMEGVFSLPKSRFELF